MDYNETLIRKAASLTRRAGFSVLVSMSNTTESCYLSVGHPSRHGGFETLATLRVSNHCKPGWFRGGWIAASQLPYFDLRPRTRAYDRERLDMFLTRLGGKER